MNKIKKKKGCNTSELRNHINKWLNFCADNRSIEDFFDKIKEYIQLEISEKISDFRVEAYLSAQKEFDIVINNKFVFRTRLFYCDLLNDRKVAEVYIVDLGTSKTHSLYIKHENNWLSPIP